MLESTVGGHNVVFTLYSSGLNVIQTDAAQIVVTGKMSGVTITNNASARAFTLRKL